MILLSKSFLGSLVGMSLFMLLEFHSICLTLVCQVSHLFCVEYCHMNRKCLFSTLLSSNQISANTTRSQSDQRSNWSSTVATGDLKLVLFLANILMVLNIKWVFLILTFKNLMLLVRQFWMFAAIRNGKYHNFITLWNRVIYIFILCLSFHAS